MNNTQFLRQLFINIARLSSNYKDPFSFERTINKIQIQLNSILHFLLLEIKEIEIADKLAAEYDAEEDGQIWGADDYAEFYGTSIEDIASDMGINPDDVSNDDVDWGVGR